MLKVHLRRTLLFAVIAGFLGWLFATNSPKIYQARVELKAGSPLITADPTMPLEVRRVLLPGVLNDLDSDTGTLRSQRIFKDGLVKAASELNKESLATSKTFAELFPMFDLDIPSALNQYDPNQTRVVSLQVRAYTPADAASIANNVAYAFSDYRKQQARLAIQDALGIVDSAAKNAKTELDAIDKEYRAVKIEGKIGDMNATNEVLTTSFEQLQQKKYLLDAELLGARAEAASLRAQLRTIDKNIPASSTTMPDPVVEGMRQNIISAEAELASFRQLYQESSPFVTRAKEKLARFKSDLVTAEKTPKSVKGGTQQTLSSVYLDLESKVLAANARIQSLEVQGAPLETQLAEYEARIAKIPGQETKFYELQRKRVVYEDEFQRNTKWATELRAAVDGRGNQIVSIADPETITDPVAPEVKKYTILALFVGTLIGLAYSFAMESFRLPVHTSWQLAELTALPVAAAVPTLPKPLARRHALALREASFKPIESFRFMAFSLLAKENRPTVIMFASIGEDVDSAAAAAEFAIAMSKTGSKTMLVDCDLRVPRLSELFGVQGRSGVSDVLGRTILPGESSDLFVSTEHENLQILPAGSSANTGLADFVTSHLAALVIDLREKSDTVVINCPPVDVFADASRLAQYVDETCLVISAKTTSYRAIPVAQEILQKSGAKSVSLVLNNASQTDEPFGTRAGSRSRA